MSHFLPWQRETFGFGEGDRFTLLSGLAHDPLQRDLFHALCLGASLHIPDPDRIGEPGYLAGWMRDERITVANLTPAMAQLLTEGAGDELPDLRSPSWAATSSPAAMWPASGASRPGSRSSISTARPNPTAPSPGIG